MTHPTRQSGPELEPEPGLPAPMPGLPAQGAAPRAGMGFAPGRASADRQRAGCAGRGGESAGCGWNTSRGVFPEPLAGSAPAHVPSLGESRRQLVAGTLRSPW